MSIAAAPVAPIAQPTNPTDVRRQRGMAIAAVTRIVRDKGREERWIVPSQTGQKRYIVNLVGPSPTCDCEDFVKRALPCKHVFAVEFTKLRETAPECVPAVAGTVALPARTCAPRPTYKQVWPAYNAAQIHEKEKFQSLLHELCRAVPSPEANPKGGRPPVLMADRAFACAFKVYTTISGRRASTDMRDARAKGHLSRSPHYSGVSRYLEDPAMTPILVGLIAESARPLRSIESDFAIDSSGFSTSRFVRWFDHKYGVVRKSYSWVKVSVMTGVKTNVVTAASVDGRYDADSPRFAPLLNATVAAGFKPREVSADAAYISYDSADLVAAHGGTPYMGFRSGITGEGGGAFSRMFHLFSFNRDEYLSHYHKRSNVESTFSMMKAKFGDSLRSKTDIAMRNEALCKVLCHNICCLIQAIYELGIVATFWETDATISSTNEFANDDDTWGAWDWM